MIHFLKEGTPYKIGLNIKLFKPYFLKISLIIPLPFCIKSTYTDLFGDIRYKGWRIFYFGIQYTRHWGIEDLITLRFYFNTIGKQKIVSNSKKTSSFNKYNEVI